MSEMVERAAKAICRGRHDCDPDKRMPLAEANASGPPLWTSYARDARAAIEAMRDPTEAMKEAGTGFWDYTVGRSDSQAVWQLMLAAALASEDERK